MRNSHHFEASSFRAVLNKIKERMLSEAHPIHTGTWQAKDISARPEASMYELLNVTLTVPLDRHRSMDSFRADIEPNLPWADDHFEERVCGYPINPGLQWKRWPWGNHATGSLASWGGFNHNYMERLWPKYAGGQSPSETVEEWISQSQATPPEPNEGLRWAYGDLRDVVDLVRKDPLTRQAWIPLFFPEDTGIGDGDRKPCTLGYQFILRGGGLHLYYPLRSCDFHRHFRDDIYLAIRLMDWMAHQVEEDDHPWHNVPLLSYSMHCTSLHVFANDFYQMGGRPR